MALRVTLEELHRSDRGTRLDEIRAALTWYQSHRPTAVDARQVELLADLDHLLGVVAARLDDRSSLYALLALGPCEAALRDIVDLMGSDGRSDDVSERILDIWEACGDFLQVSGSDLAVSDRLRALERAADDKVQGIQAAFERAERSADAVREVVTRSSIGTYAEAFRAESARQGRASQRWLLAGCLLGVVVIAAIYWLSTRWSISPDAGLAQIIEHTAVRLTIVSLLVFGIVNCFNNYSARVHYCEAMRFKALTLETFPGLVAASEGTNTQALILEQAVSAIFTPVPSGFLPSQHANTEVVQLSGGMVRDVAKGG
jgi:hypothetical protein